MNITHEDIHIGDRIADVEHRDDFISIYKNLYPEGYCQHLIEEFERIDQSGLAFKRGEKNVLKADKQVVLIPGIHILNKFNDVNPIDGFFRGLETAFNNYSTKYSYLSQVRISTSSIKMQRTDPGEGYHVWHAEAGPQEDFIMNQNRVVTYILYLNTLDLPNEGGETEFLYQRSRIAPVENTLVIWPASYTHMHRGNTVLGNRSKYIVTGWLFFG